MQAHFAGGIEAAGVIGFEAGRLHRELAAPEPVLSGHFVQAELAHEAVHRAVRRVEVHGLAIGTLKQVHRVALNTFDGGGCPHDVAEAEHDVGFIRPVAEAQRRLAGSADRALRQE